jgi:hypothetical protein
MIKYGYKRIQDLFGHKVKLGEIYTSPICRYDSDPSVAAALASSPPVCCMPVCRPFPYLDACLQLHVKRVLYSWHMCMIGCQAKWQR